MTPPSKTKSQLCAQRGPKSVVTRATVTRRADVPRRCYPFRKPKAVRLDVVWCQLMQSRDVSKGVVIATGVTEQDARRSSALDIVDTQDEVLLARIPDRPA